MERVGRRGRVEGGEEQEDGLNGEGGKEGEGGRSGSGRMGTGRGWEKEEGEGGGRLRG